MNDPRQRAKVRAALEALELVQSGMTLGLGSGSTASLFVEELGKRLRDGTLHDIHGVPTSKVTHQLANLVGVPLTSLDEHPEVDLTVDGADEVDPDGNLIKGLGGALLREKIVAAASRQLVIVVDASKLVDRLGTQSPLPVEVVQFASHAQLAFFQTLGATPALRLDQDASLFVSDEGHHIVDLRFKRGIPDPAALEALLLARPGVVETGLFLGFKPRVIVGNAAS